MKILHTGGTEFQSPEKCQGTRLVILSGTHSGLDPSRRSTTFFTYDTFFHFLSFRRPPDPTRPFCLCFVSVHPSSSPPWDARPLQQPILHTWFATLSIIFCSNIFERNIWWVLSMIRSIRLSFSLNGQKWWFHFCPWLKLAKSSHE